ncbi:hypothetical protein LCGC14_2815030, partial [marine sediment metagenome]
PPSHNIFDADLLAAVEPVAHWIYALAKLKAPEPWKLGNK